MTANANRKPQLDEVLDEFSGLSSPPDAATLRAWTKEYPEFARELVAFATDWVAMNAARVEPTKIILEEWDLEEWIDEKIKYHSQFLYRPNSPLQVEPWVAGYLAALEAVRQELVE